MRYLRRMFRKIKKWFIRKKKDEVADDQSHEESSKHDVELETEDAIEKRREALERSRDSQFGKRDIDRK